MMSQRRRMIAAAICIVAAAGCAGNGRREGSAGSRLLHSHDDYRIGLLSSDAWFTLETFQQQIDTLHRRLDDVGMPRHVQEEMRPELPRTMPLIHAMADEIRSGRSAFCFIGIHPRPGVRLRIREGAFLVDLTDPATGTERTLEDHGALILFQEGMKLGVLDTALGPKTIDSELMEKRSDRPISVYLRLPPECTGWTVRGLSVTPGAIEVMGS